MSKHRLVVAIGCSLLLLAALVLLALTDRGFRLDLAKTDALASWAVAAGTAILALATFDLARRARDEAEAVRKEATQVGEQIELQCRQIALAARPYVYPLTDPDWLTGWGPWAGRNHNVMPVKNGGPGLALNVRGRITWNIGPGSWRRTTLIGSSVAPGDDARTLLTTNAAGDGGWPGARGYLKYWDLNGDAWVTYFGFDHGDANYLRGYHDPPLLIEYEEDDPDRLDDANLAAKAREDEP